MLFVALSSYILFEWFEVGCRVFSFYGEKLIQPLCEILGVDDEKKVKRDDRG
jgi:hypothetical protein